MNESEKRRRDLLKQTRQLYADSVNIPAVHPRYTGLYHGLYGTGEQKEKAPSQTNSFYLRLFLSLILFFCFLYMDEYDLRIAEADCKMIIQQINRNQDMDSLKEVWNESKHLDKNSEKKIDIFNNRIGN